MGSGSREELSQIPFTETQLEATGNSHKKGIGPLRGCLGRPYPESEALPVDKKAKSEVKYLGTFEKVISGKMLSDINRVTTRD